MIKNVSKSLIICICVLCAVYLIISLKNRPIIFSDAIHGYISLHNYLNGGGWNKQLQFNANATKLNVQNLTWWAPGQYELPYFVAKLLYCSVGFSISILSFISIIVGGFLYYKIFRRSYLPITTVLAALLILLLQRFININFILFSSSDLFLFTCIPLYIYSYLKVKELHTYYWVNLIVLLLVNLFGLFIKNGFLLFSTAFNTYLAVEFFEEYLNIKKQVTILYLIKRATFILPYLLSVLLFYWFFLRLGSNPTSGAGFLINFTALISGAFSGCFGVIFSALSANSFYGNIQGKMAFLNPYITVLMFGFLLILFYLIYLSGKNIKNRFKTDVMFRITFIVSIMYVLYWIIFTLKRSYISNEDRLFLPATILSFPYLIDYCFKAPKFLKFTAYIIICLSIVYGVGTMYYRIKTYSSDNMSTFSNDHNLYGFKLFTHQPNETAQLNLISKFVSTGYKNEAIIAADPDALLLLNTTNQYIIVNGTNIPVVINDSKKYLLLVDKTEKINSKGWQQIYTTINYNLFLSN
ncbi:hypothetical protein [Mucilaginibacter sp.]